VDTHDGRTNSIDDPNVDRAAAWGQLSAERARPLTEVKKAQGVSQPLIRILTEKHELLN
jgi:hypothetical protein